MTEFEMAEMSAAEESQAKKLSRQPKWLQEQILSRLSKEQLKNLPYDWNFWARPKQIAPAGPWDIWLINAGRGFGKTRAGAQWVQQKADENPGCIIALVGPTAGDVRRTMVTGESGLTKISPPWNRASYHPANAIVKWKNGSVGLLYSADEPDRLRGPNHHWAWCLVGETPILMGDGTEKNLADIQIGDYVLTRKGSRRVISSELTRKMSQVYQLRLMDGRSIAGTAEHPVFIEGNGFVPISELFEGMNVLCASPVVTFSTQKIVSVEKSAILRDVYNLTVEGENEFFANGILTHNCDELTSWRYDIDAWNMLTFTLRLGTRPQTLITTTPKPTKLYRDILKDAIELEDWNDGVREKLDKNGEPVERTVVVTRGSTFENRDNLAASFFSTIISQYGDSTLGRQEILAQVLEDIEGALWQREWFQHIKPALCPEFKRVVVSVDPAVTANKRSNQTGICVAAKGVDDNYYILHLKGYRVTPKSWADEVIRLMKKHDAGKVVAEVNNGGDMVGWTLRAVDPNIIIKDLHASKGKRTRAENISTLYEQKRVWHVGSFSDGEEQMCLFTGDPSNTKEEDDMVDALVWALTELSDNAIRPTQPPRAAIYRGVSHNIKLI